MVRYVVPCRRTTLIRVSKHKAGSTSVWVVRNTGKNGSMYDYNPGTSQGATNGTSIYPYYSINQLSPTVHFSRPRFPLPTLILPRYGVPSTLPPLVQAIVPRHRLETARLRSFCWQRGRSA